MLLSELATNVVMHTDCSALAVTICVRPESVRFGVSDCEPHQMPKPRGAADDRPGGFGLRLVEKLASGWGVAVDPFGKAVWFDLPRVLVGTDAAAVQLA